MSNSRHFKQYQAQAVRTASPEQLIVKLYDLGISACHREDRSKLRSVLKELISSLNMDRGGEIASRLYELYAFCMEASVRSDLTPVAEILDGLRTAWKETVLVRKAA